SSAAFWKKTPTAPRATPSGPARPAAKRPPPTRRSRTMSWAHTRRSRRPLQTLFWKKQTLRPRRRRGNSKQEETMKKSNFVALILGTVGCVFFALGMCMCLIQEWGVSRQGIVCGAAGLVVLLADLLIWRKMEGKAPIVVSPRTLGLVALGVAGALLLGVGMCLSMVFGKLVAGIVVGLIGIVALLLIPLAKGLKD